MTIQDKDIYSKEMQKNARSGAESWYEEIWKNTDKCVFCDLRDKYIIYEENGMVLTVNVFPYIDGHLMIIPRRHLVYVKELTTSEWETVRKLIYVGKKLLHKSMGIKSLWTLYREGPLGEESSKTVEHMHIHLIPYIKELVDIHFQEIDLPGEDLAKKLRKEMPYIQKKLQKFEAKYARKK